MCGVKNAFGTAGDRKSWRKMGVFGENTHELEKNAKMLEKINIIMLIKILCMRSSAIKRKTFSIRATSCCKIKGLLMPITSNLQVSKQ